MLFQILSGAVIHREDSILCACLNSHIRHRKPVIHRKRCNPVPGKFHGLIQCAVHPDPADNMDDNILSAYIWSRLSSKHKLHRARDLKPQLSGCHAGGNICCPDACRKRTQRTICTSMGICTDNTLSCCNHSRFRKNCMLYS